MKSELVVKFQFIASHSLAGYETPHSHRWGLELVISGDIKNGKIIDLPSLRENIQTLIEPLESQHLNDCRLLPDEAQKFPTCETLSLYFYEDTEKLLINKFLPENPSLQLKSVLISLSEMDGTEMGAVRLVLHS